MMTHTRRTRRSPLILSFLVLCTLAASEGGDGDPTSKAGGQGSPEGRLPHPVRRSKLAPPKDDISRGPGHDSGKRQQTFTSILNPRTEHAGSKFTRTSTNNSQSGARLRSRQFGGGFKSRLQGVSLDLLEDARHRTFMGRQPTSCADLIRSHFQLGARPVPLGGKDTDAAAVRGEPWSWLPPLYADTSLPAGTASPTAISRTKVAHAAHLVFAHIPKNAGAEIEKVTYDARKEVRRTKPPRFSPAWLAGYGGSSPRGRTEGGVSSITTFVMPASTGNVSRDDKASPEPPETQCNCSVRCLSCYAPLAGANYHLPCPLFSMSLP